MTLETIQRRQFNDPDRAAVQETVARAVEKDPDRFIDQYLSMEQSLGGHYVSADLFKEIFEEYGASKYSRNRYNAPVHDSAAVLASEYLRRLINAPRREKRDTVILLTGIPGAGKTSSVLRVASCHRRFERYTRARSQTLRPRLQKCNRYWILGQNRSLLQCMLSPNRRCKTHCSASRKWAAAQVLA
jgi:hypothetical protein